MRVSRPTLRYAALHAAYWSGFCLVLAFSSVLLLARGLTNAQIGVVLAAAGAVSAALQPPVAGFAARTRWPLRHWITGLGVLIAAAAGSMVVLPADVLRDGLLFGTVLCLIQLVVPLLNAVGMDTAAEGVPIDFGTARALGSFAFALTSVGVGAVVAGTGPGVLPWLIVGTQVLMIAAALTFRFKTVDAAGASLPDARLALPDLPALDAARRRRFWLLIIGLTGAFTSHAAINSFLFQVVRHHGGNASDMGLAAMIAATLETIPMLFFARLVRHWRPDTWLRFAAAAFAVKALVTWLAPNLALFYVAQTLQMFAFALVIPASVYYVDRLLPLADRTRGQAWMTLTLTAGNVVAGLFGGVLLDASGVPALLLFGTVAAALGTLGVFAGTERV